MDRLTPTEQRTANLCAYFGWQGGTIHQLAYETGIDVATLLYTNVDSNDTQRIRGYELCSEFAKGQFAANTCAPTMRLKLAAMYKGCRDYWLGVALSKTNGNTYAVR